MNCRSAEEWIQQSLDAPLTPAQRLRLDAHLEGCAACRRAWEEYRLLSRQATEWVARPEPEEMASAEFSAQVLSRLAQRSERASGAHSLWAVAILVLLCVTLLSPLAAPWLPALPHWNWPTVPTDAPFGDTVRATVSRWAEILLGPALAANLLLLRRARRLA